MPAVPEQRWSCNSCGLCCRSLVGHLFNSDTRRLDEQGWREELDVPPYIATNNGLALNKRADGACVFLTEDNRCLIHAKFGEAGKPLACRIFPFSVRPEPGAWRASLRFDCPSVTESRGKPITQYQPWLSELVKELHHHAGTGEHARLDHRCVATAGELHALQSRLVRWLKKDSLPLFNRIVGAARMTSMLSQAKFRRVREERFGELLDVLLRGLSVDSLQAPPAPTERQLGMLRQVVFAHCEHVSLHDLRAGALRKLQIRWRQLSTARRMLRGRGDVPLLLHDDDRGPVRFEQVDAVTLNPAVASETEAMFRRYLVARLEGRSVWGYGYYKWPVFSGLAALWLSVAAAGWLARYLAAADAESSLQASHVDEALRIVDRTATRAPALGSAAERLRIRFLLSRDGLPAVLTQYALWPPLWESNEPAT